jgi:hypothetical protein
MTGSTGSGQQEPGRLRVGWFAVTDSVVISDEVTEDEVEIPRSEWVRFVAAVKSGQLDEPWLPAPVRDESVRDAEGGER